MRAHGTHCAANPMAMSASAGERRRNAMIETNAMPTRPSHQMTMLPES